MDDIMLQAGLFAGSIILCFLVYYISLNFFPLLTRNLDLNNQMRNNNLGVAILTSGFVISVTVLMYMTSKELIKLFTLEVDPEAGISILDNGIRAVIMFTMSMFIAFLINWFTMKSFMLASTGIDDMKELKNNNLAVSFLITSMIIATTYMVMEPLSLLNQAFIIRQTGGEYGLQLAFIDLTVFLSGLIELFIMLITSVILFLTGMRITGYVTRGMNEFVEFKNDNVALSLIVCSSILSVMIMVKYSIKGYVHDISLVTTDPSRNPELFITVIRYMYVLFTSTLVSIFVLWLSMGIYLLLSRMFDSMNEIKKRNVATAVILSVFTFSASFILRSGIVGLVKMITFF